MNWRRNLYIEAIVKEYGRYGVGTEDIRKRVNTLALKGTPAEKRIQPKSGTPETKKKESAADKAQKLMLTWLVNYPGIFEQVEKYICPSDFVVPLYKEVAQMLFEQHKEGETNPGKLLNAFTDSEEQREVASLFNATIHLENEGEQQRAFSDALSADQGRKPQRKKPYLGPVRHGRASGTDKSKKRTGRPWKKEAAAAYFFQLRIKYKHYMEV